MKVINDNRIQYRINLITSRVFSDELVKLIEPLKKADPNVAPEKLEKLKVKGDVVAKKVKKEVEKEFGTKFEN